jgi:hypothetical protein
MGVPQCPHTHIVMRLEFVVQFCGFPVPDVQFPVCIPRNQVTEERKRSFISFIGRQIYKSTSTKEHSDK